MLLEDRNAVIYGGGGSIGGAVARAFAGEGARVFSPVVPYRGSTTSRGCAAFATGSTGSTRSRWTSSTST